VNIIGNFLFVFIKDEQQEGAKIIPGRRLGYGRKNRKNVLLWSLNAVMPFVLLFFGLPEFRFHSKD